MGAVTLSAKVKPQRPEADGSTPSSDEARMLRHVLPLPHTCKVKKVKLFQ
jgi:hypothetical protein